MNKRYMYVLLSALVLIKGRALFLLHMEFLDRGGMVLLALTAGVILAKKGVKNAAISVICYFLLCLFLWSFNALYEPYEGKDAYKDKELIILTESLIQKAEANYTRDFEAARVFFEAPKIMNAESAKVSFSEHPEIMDHFRISGIFIPFTGRILLNENEAGFLIPFIACHELAHRSGILNEGQANMHAFIKCMESGEKEFRYSACVYALKHALGILKSRNEAVYSRLAQTIDPKVLSDLNKMSIARQRFDLLDYSGLIPLLIYRQSITSQGVI